MGNTNFGLPIDQRLVPEIAPFTDLRDLIFGSLKVAGPAIVVAFHPGPPATVDVQLAINQVWQQNVNAPNAPVNVQRISLPTQVLKGLVVQIPSAGGWSLTLPIAVGDECLAVFCDGDIDSWFQSGGSQTPMRPSRQHSLSDGIAIFGIRSKPRGLANYSTSALEIRNDANTIKISMSASSGITITASTIKLHGAVAVVDGFGANGASPQTPAASGGPSAGTLPETTTLANAIRLALIANGIMS
jgi:hypothetical protein